MKIKALPPIFLEAVPVLKTLNQAGFQAYFVGGSIRDLLLKRQIHDIDIATSAYPDEIKHLFSRTIDTGIKHGTVTVLSHDSSYEITTFRTESGYQDYRRPDHVTFVQNLSEDLKRRDFTINAMAMDANGEITDLFHGIADLHDRVIKAVGQAETRFHEDALRMMRAVRFMSQLQFDLEPQTYQAICDNHALLKKISVERIREEFVQMGIGPGSVHAFKAFLNSGLSEEVPYFKGQKKQLEIFPKLNFSPSIEPNLWALIIILLKLTDDEIPLFMHAWKTSNALTRQVKKIVTFFDLASDRTPSNLELFDYGLETIMCTIDVAHILGQPINGEALIDSYQVLPIKKNSDLDLDGHFLLELGVQPGPGVGRLLEQAKEAVLNGKVVNERRAIADYLITKK